MSTAATSTPTNNAAAIRRFWERGRQSRARLSTQEREKPESLRAPRKGPTYKKEAERIGTDVDTAAKMRRFAEDYSRDDIKAIADQLKGKSSRFGTSHLRILMRLEDRDLRDQMMDQAIDQGWSAMRIERAVQARRGNRRPYVGRKPRIPTALKEKLVALDALCERWRRWCIAAKLPESLQAEIHEAVKAVVRVQEMVAEELKRRSNRK
jgi:hypothetical protein